MGRRQKSAMQSIENLRFAVLEAVECGVFSLDSRGNIRSPLRHQRFWDRPDAAVEIAPLLSAEEFDSLVAAQRSGGLL
jgi:hypothetical protein